MKTCKDTYFLLISILYKSKTLKLEINNNYNRTFFTEIVNVEEDCICFSLIKKHRGVFSACRLQTNKNKRSE